MTLKILGRVTSINVRKVLWAAGEMGLDYDREDWGLPLRDPKVPHFLALNPNGQVPVLIEGDFVLWESTAIMTYLAQGYGPTPLLPEDKQAQALCNQWLAWPGTELAPVWGYAVMALARKVAGYDDAGKINASLAAWSGKMGIIEAQLGKTGNYIAGPAMTLADIAIGLAVHRWFSVERELEAMPQAKAYLERLRQRPAGADWLTSATP